MRNIFLICLLVSFISTGKLYAHDESGFISVECSHAYSQSQRDGVEKTKSNIAFAFSKNNLKKHGIVNMNTSFGMVPVVAEITNLAGNVEKYANQFQYMVSGDEVTFPLAWFTAEMAHDKEAAKEMKARLGAKPSVNCKVIY